MPDACISCKLPLQQGCWAARTCSTVSVDDQLCRYRDAQLSSVLDNGTGHPTALAVLYMEVARRLGSPMVCHTPQQLPKVYAAVRGTPVW